MASPTLCRTTKRLWSPSRKAAQGPRTPAGMPRRAATRNKGWRGKSSNALMISDARVERHRGGPIALGHCPYDALGSGSTASPAGRGFHAVHEHIAWFPTPGTSDLFLPSFCRVPAGRCATCRALAFYSRLLAMPSPAANRHIGELRAHLHDLPDCTGHFASCATASGRHHVFTDGSLLSVGIPQPCISRLGCGVCHHTPCHWLWTSAWNFTDHTSHGNHGDHLRSQVGQSHCR